MEEHVAPETFVAQTIEGRTNPQEQVAERFDDFAERKWTQLLRASKKCDEEAAAGMHRKRRRATQANELAARATVLFMEELSVGQEALEGARTAPGNQDTLKNSFRQGEETTSRESFNSS